jgi:hypothetical protein
VEGKLIAPWVAEFTTACEKAIAGCEANPLLADFDHALGFT